MQIRNKKRFFRDCLLGTALLCLLLAIFLTGSTNAILSRQDATIDQTYLSKQGADGSYYIVDQGHERVLHLTEEGQYLWQIRTPEGQNGTSLYVEDLAVSGDGTVYLQVSDWDGMHIDRELILVYSSKGQYLNTLAEAAYDCSTINKHSRFGLYADGDALTYLYADGDKLHTMRVSGDSMQVLNTKQHADAVNRIADAVFTDDAVLILEKNGVISRIREDISEVLYDAALETDANRTPFRMCMDAEHNIYFTDIRSRTVKKLTNLPGQSITVVTDTDSITVQSGRNHRLLLSEPEQLRIVEEAGEETTIYALHFSKHSLVIRYGVIALMIAAGLLAAYFVFRLLSVIMKYPWTSAQRTGLLLMVCVVVAVSLVSIKLIEGFRVTYREKIQEELTVTAFMVANLLDADDITNINTAADFDGESYSRLSDRMQWAFSSDVDLYDQVYCNILRTDTQGHAWAIAYYDQSIGTYYPLEAGEAEDTLRVVSEKLPVWDAGSSLVSGTFCNVRVPVFDSQGQVAGVVEVGTETMVLENMIANVTRQLLMTLAVLILLIWLAVSELIAYTGAEEKYRKRLSSGGKTAGILPGHLIRLLVFLVFAAYNMTSSFLPVYILRSTDAWAFADKELMASLPITLNIFFIGTMALCCAGLLRKVSIRTLTMISALFSMAGNLLIYSLPTYPCILLGLGLDGIGMGLSSNAVYVLLSRLRSEEERLDGFTIYNAACISGINFGMMLGSILAANFTQHIVFACVAVMWLMVVGITVVVDRYTRNMLGAGEAENPSSIALSAFLRSKGILAFIVLIQNPYILFNSFVYYFVPIFCDELGYGETTVSLLLMGYALFAVYLSETITKFMNRTAGKQAMYIALALNITAVVLFAWIQTLAALFAALVLMGLSASFGKTVQQDYFMELRAVKLYGEDRSIGLYNFTENIGESLGPTVFGKLIVFTPRSVAFSCFSGMIAVCSALHYAVSHRNNTHKEDASCSTTENVH